MDKLFLTSPAFEDGGLIPVEHTGFGADSSPRLELSGLSEWAVSLAVTLDDMTHLIPAYNHWSIWNLPPQLVIPGSIPQGERVDALGGAVQGRGYGRNRYRGPKPPFHQSHVYRFTLFALDCALVLPSTARKKDLLAAMEGHILQQAVLMGHYR